MKQEWFANWFDSPYYHILYKHRNDAEAEYFIDNIVTHLKLVKNQTILDLACGKGRHSIYLNKKGFDVTGVDLSANSIKDASQYENDTLSFFTHDMRKPIGAGCFDVILNLFTSFGYFEKEKEDVLVLKNVCSALKHKGLFVLDYLNCTTLEQQGMCTENKEIDGIEFKTKKIIENGFVKKQIEFSDKGTDYRFSESVKLLYLKDFQRLFKTAGLEIINVYGDYDFNSFNESASKRLILVAKKCSSN